jgi:hypothetical protein
MNAHTDHAIAMLTTALAPRFIKRNGEITAVSVAWIPSMQRKYVNLILAALLAGVEREQVQQQRIAMLEAKLKEAIEWGEIVENHYVDLCILVDPPIGNEVSE